MLNIFKKKKVNAECVCEDTKMYSYKECTHVYGVAQTDLTDMEKKAAAVFGFNAHWVIRCSFYNPDKRVAYEEDVKRNEYNHKGFIQKNDYVCVHCGHRLLNYTNEIRKLLNDRYLIWAADEYVELKQDGYKVPDKFEEFLDNNRGAWLEAVSKNRDTNPSVNVYLKK